jgi:NADH:ubiquinone oxidoreductase subunit D
MASPITSDQAYGWRIEDLDVDEMILNMGPQHPSTHGRAAHRAEDGR